MQVYLMFQNKMFFKFQDKSEQIKSEHLILHKYNQLTCHREHSSITKSLCYILAY